MPSLEHDPFTVAMFSLAAATVVGAILQYVAARAAKKRDSEGGMFGQDLLDQQRQMIRDLRSQLNNANQEIDEMTDLISSKDALLKRRADRIATLERQLGERNGS